MPFAFKNLESVEAGKLHEACQFALPHIRKLVRSIATENLDEIRKASYSLTGFGPGLTPSGDDVLAMLMATMALSAEYFKIGMDRVRAINDSILCAGNGRTSLLSQRLMEHAALGEVSDSVCGLIEALLFNKDHLWVRIENMLRFGATSGADMLLGIVIGLNLITRLKSDSDNIIVTSAASQRS